LSLALGTFVLVFSNTFYYQNVALLLTPIIVTALLLDLMFLPTLLIKFDNWWERQEFLKRKWKSPVMKPADNRGRKLDALLDAWCALMRRTRRSS
jgi:hypothetical protein